MEKFNVDTLNIREELKEPLRRGNELLKKI